MEHKDLMVVASKHDDIYLWCEENCDGIDEEDDFSRFLFKNAHGDILEELEEHFDEIYVL